MEYSRSHDSEMVQHLYKYLVISRYRVTVYLVISRYRVTVYLALSSYRLAV